MRTARRHDFGRILISLLLFATTPFAHSAPGDGIGGVEVGIFKKPRKGVVVQSRGGEAFDRVTLRGSRSFADSLRPERLPGGWTMSRKGREVTLAGPAATPPVRILLAVDGELPKEVSYEVASRGRILARHDDLVPPEIEIPVPSNSLVGQVVLPSQVRPGELVTFQSTGPAGTGGSWTLSGVVAEPWDREELAAAFAELPASRAAVAGKAVRLPARGVALQLAVDATVTCDGLAPYLALLSASRPELAGYTVARAEEQGPSRGAVAYEVADLGAITGAQASAAALGNAARPSHEVAMNAVRNLKRFYTVEPAGSGTAPGSGDAGVARPRGRRSAFTLEPAEEGSGGPALRVVCGPNGCFEFKPLPMDPPPPMEPVEVEDPPLKGGIAPAPRPQGKSFYESRSNLRTVAMWVESTGGGCRLLPREPSDLEVAGAWRDAQAGKASTPRPCPPNCPEERPSGREVYAAELPAGLRPGDALSVRLADAYGDLVLDVPRAPVEVLPPRAPAERAPAPCLRSGTVYSQSEQLLCVCGSFPTPAAWSGLLLDERPIPDTVSTSSSVVWFRPPPDLALGRHVVSGTAAAGFAPACKAETQRIAIRGEVDGQSLLRGESTPMRLTVDGTGDRLPVRIENLTPAIIDIEGGLDQTVESTGGGANTITRSVRGLQRGDFNVRWTLTTPECPCGPGS